MLVLYNYTLKTFALRLTLNNSEIQQSLSPLPCIMAVLAKIASQKKHDLRLFIMYEARKTSSFFLFLPRFFFSKIMNKEAKFAIFHIRMVKLVVNDERTFKYKWHLIYITQTNTTRTN